VLNAAFMAVAAALTARFLHNGGRHMLAMMSWAPPEPAGWAA